MRSESGELRRNLIVLAVLLAPLAILLAHLGDFPFPSGSEFSDFAVSHYPNALFLQQSVSRYGEIPFWSNTILCGYPFAANPLSGLWYPPGWIAFLLPLPAGLNLVVALHLLWSGFGMFRLLGSRGIAFPAALAGAVVFLANPKIFAHLAAGHVTLLYAVSWTPWLLLAETRKNLTLLAGAVLGLILLADARWAIPAGMIWLVWKIALAVNRQRAQGAGFGLPAVRQVGLSVLLNASAALLIAAPLLILLGEYSALSTRSQLAAAEQLALSLPAESLIGLLAPDFSAYAEWVTYFGALPLLLLVYALAEPGVRKRALFWVVVLVVSILLSLGSAVPGLAYLWRLPGLSLLRVPSRMMFLGGVAFAFLTACSLDDLLARRPVIKPDPVFWMTPLTAFAWLLTIGLWVVSGEVSREFLWSAAALTIAVLLVVIRQRTPFSNRLWAGLVLVVLLADLAGVGALNLRFEPPEVALSTGAAALPTGLEEPYRVYSPSYSLPQHTAAAQGLELADGVDPLQLEAYAAFFERASGIERDGYSVTLPPDPLEPVEANPQRAAPDTERLGLLNVRYLVAAYPLTGDGLETLQEGEGLYVYENRHARPRAWVQADLEPVSAQSRTQPVITRRTPNTIEIAAEGPGQLVLAEVMYPGWRAWVDGQEAEITPFAGLLRSVALTGGQHQVRFEFHPRGLGLGVALTFAGWLLVVGVATFLQKRARSIGQRRSSHANG